MTSRGIKFSSNNDEGETSRLLDYDVNEDDFEVSFEFVTFLTLFVEMFYVFEGHKVLTYF